MKVLETHPYSVIRRHGRAICERIDDSPWKIRQRIKILEHHKMIWKQTFKDLPSLAKKRCKNPYPMDLSHNLLKLRVELKTARNKMNKVEARVEQNIERINRLKNDVDKLEPIPMVSRSLDKILASPVTNRSRHSVTRPTSKKGVLNSRKNRSLESSLEIEPALKEFWYPVEFSRTLGPNTLVPVELFDDQWVLFRGKDGRPSCVKDSCAHRACPLSLGKVENGEVACAYHGWKFAGDGECVAMPSTVFIKGIGISVIPCVEVDGLIWVYPGENTPPEEVPHRVTQSPRGFDIHAELLLEVSVEHGLLIENLLDLAHAPFTHTSTFAKGWAVPDLVAFKTVEVLGGQWHPYPIDMSFAPPCMTLSTIGLSQPGKIEKGQQQEDCQNHLHQLHVCVPGGKGKTRLLYRMSLDFISWAKDLPFMDRLWKRVADQVLNEDLRLVLGQQNNLVRQGPSATWANPVTYDKLAVRYRRWRNNLN